MSTVAVVFLILVFFQFNIGSGSGSAGIAQNRNLQDGANTDSGDVGWWQGLSDAFIFLIPILYGNLQVIFQGKSESPFVKHQTNMWISIIATCFYAFTFAATKKAIPLKTTYFMVLNYIAFFSGALSTVSILSIILPFKLGLIFYVIWSLALAFSICCHFNLHTIWTKSLCDMFNKLRGGDTDTDTTLSPQHPIDDLV